VEFRILGSLEVTLGPDRLELGGSRQQIVLAALLLSAGNVVSLGRLQEAIYGGDLPPTSRSQAQISISSLRRLFAGHGHPAAIATHAHGYAIQAADGQLDSRRFEELAAAARAARDAGDLVRAVGGYRDALRLWRGPALEGIDSLLVRAAAGRLDEQRIATTENRIDLELELGRHHELTGELSELVRDFPLREQLRGQLMLALYRCDRSAEALAVYRQGRQEMVDELGIEPGSRLKRLEHAILTSDPALDPPAAPVRIQPVSRTAPGLLPADIGDFTGRAEEVSLIHRRLIPGAGQERRAVPMMVVTGQGGVGKTSIAVHASHGITAHFTDGQLFADLHGGTARPAGPVQVLERFLLALGVPGAQIPEGLDERAEMYRSLLDGRKVLVVLDDAVSEGQVLPLIPGSGATAVMITSRSRLAGLPGATRLEVDVLDAGKSLDLLARVAGDGRVQDEPRAAAEVAGHCGHLPLALRIAGARLSARPKWSIRQLADRLADETRRLDELKHGDLGIRATISLTYEHTGEQARRLFRRLALLDLPHFSAWLGAALLDQPLATAEDLLEELVGAQLIEATGSGAGVRSHYRFHELIRVFARERVAAEEMAADRAAALERALGALLYLAEQAHRRDASGDYLQLQSDALRWPLPDRVVEELVGDPLSWYEHERAALVAGVRQAAQAGLVDLCWSLAHNSETLFESRAYMDDWRETAHIALEATREARHVSGQAAMLYLRGALNLAQQRFGPARQDHIEAAALFQDAGDEQGFALVTRNIAFMDRLSGRFEDAIKRYDHALVIFRRTGNRMATAYVLHNLALVKLDLHDPVSAQELLTEALQLIHTPQGGRVEAQVLYVTGDAYLLTGDLDRAVGFFERALAIVRRRGDPIGEAYVLRGIGVAKVRQGEYGPARSALQRAVDLAGSSGERRAGARALLGLSELALAIGDSAQAAGLAQQATGVFQEMGAPLEEARALTALSAAHAAGGDRAAADVASARAADLRANFIADPQGR